VAVFVAAAPIAAAAILVAIVVIAVTFGTQPVSISRAIADASSLDRIILLEARAPRVFLGAVAGAGLAAVGLAFALSRFAWPAYGLLGLLAFALARRTKDGRMMTAAWVVLTTLVIHAIFFGAGRYGLLVVPFVTFVPFLVRFQRPEPSS